MNKGGISWVSRQRVNENVIETTACGFYVKKNALTLLYESRCLVGPPQNEPKSANPHPYTDQTTLPTTPCPTAPAQNESKKSANPHPYTWSIRTPKAIWRQIWARAMSTRCGNLVVQDCIRVDVHLESTVSTTFPFSWFSPGFGFAKMMSCRWELA